MHDGIDSWLGGLKRILGDPQVHKRLWNDDFDSFLIVYSDKVGVESLGNFVLVHHFVGLSAEVESSTESKAELTGPDI